MPNQSDFTTIFSGYDSIEAEDVIKQDTYVFLLEMNAEFVKDVESLRTKYKIDPDSQTINTYSNSMDEMPYLFDDINFTRDVRKISDRIKLQGDWSESVKLYTLGLPSSESLLPNDYENMRRIEARAVSDTTERYVELRLYGDITRKELVDASKPIRKYLKDSQGFVNVKQLNENTLHRMLKISTKKSLFPKKSFKTIVEELGYSQAYSDLRRQYQDYKSYADRLY